MTTTTYIEVLQAPLPDKIIDIENLKIHQLKVRFAVACVAVVGFTACIFSTAITGSVFMLFLSVLQALIVAFAVIRVYNQIDKCEEDMTVGRLG